MKQVRNWVVLAAVLVGCEQRPEAVGVMNVGTDRLDDAELTYRDFDFIFGVLVPRAQKSYWNPPIPDLATLRWRHGTDWHCAEVELIMPLPKPGPREVYEIFFKIGGPGPPSVGVEIWVPGSIRDYQGRDITKSTRWIDCAALR